MTAKELKRLRRSDLLEMLLALRKENDQLRAQLQQAQQKLEDRRIQIENSGSLAEAALRLSGIFEAAQEACDRYTENVQQRLAQQEQALQKKHDSLLAEVKEQTASYDWLLEIMNTPEKQDGKR